MVVRPSKARTRHMTQITVNVRPLRAGGADCGPDFGLQAFIAGRAAERSAVRLAAAFTLAGRGVKVVIHDRSDSAAGELDAGPHTHPVQRRFTIH